MEHSTDPSPARPRQRWRAAVAIGLVALSSTACGAERSPTSVAADAGTPPNTTAPCSATTDGYELPAEAVPDGYRSTLGLVDNPGLTVGPTTARTFVHPTLPDEHVTVVTGDSDALESLFPAASGDPLMIDGHAVRVFDGTDERPTGVAGVEGVHGPGTWRSAVISTDRSAGNLGPIAVAAVTGADLHLGPLVATADLNGLLGLRPSTYVSYAAGDDEAQAITVQYAADDVLPTSGTYLGTRRSDRLVRGCAAIEFEVGTRTTLVWSDTAGVVAVTAPSDHDLGELAEALVAVDR